MTSPIDRRLWYQPVWVHYVSSILLAAAGLGTRFALTPIFGTNAPYGISVLPVAAAAYIGGTGPGLVCALVGFGGATLLFNNGNQPVQGTYLSLGIVSAISLIVSLIAGRLRKTAMRNSRLTEKAQADGRQMREVLDSISDAFFAVDEKWRVLQTNPPFDTMTESKGVVVGKNLLSEFADQSISAMFPMLKGAMVNRTSSTMEMQEMPSSRWYQVRAYPTEVGLSVFIQDVTERKKLDQTREQMLASERVARSAAEEANQLKDEFLAALSHELRTPLTSLVGWASMLSRGSVTPERLKEGLASIEQSAQVQAKMVEELLDISRINAGKLGLEFEFLTLDEVIEEAVSIQKVAADSKGLTLEFADDSPDSLVRADLARLHQILANLISNAIKFTERGGKIVLRTFSSAGKTGFTVEDNGIGIPEEFRPFLFDRFRQANASYSRKSGGLGLGLSIAKKLIELQGGEIEVFSEGTGKGSTFKVTFPVVTMPKPREYVEPGLQGEHRIDGKHILIVEDDDATRNLLRHFIEDHGGTAHCLADAPAALKEIAEINPDAIVSDIGLPEMDGYQFIKNVRSMGNGFSRIPAIALTAFARDEDRRIAKESGFSDFQTKPINEQMLIKKLGDLLGIPAI